MTLPDCAEAMHWPPLTTATLLRLLPAPLPTSSSRSREQDFQLCKFDDTAQEVTPRKCLELLDVLGLLQSLAKEILNNGDPNHAYKWGSDNFRGLS